jgi:hypothetical protein
MYSPKHNGKVTDKYLLLLFFAPFTIADIFPIFSVNIHTILSFSPMS